MSDTITTERPKAKRRLRKIDAAMRLRIEQAIQSMIDTLDALDALAEDREPEDEGSDDEKEGDGDPDDEPSLGASDSVNQDAAWSLASNSGLEGEDPEGDELDTLEASDLEIHGESDSDRGGSDTVDHEPSLGSLDRRMNQTKWSRPDNTPRGIWNIATDAEDDGLVHSEGDDAKECGDDDVGCDEAVGVQGDEVGVTWPPIANANDAFGGVA